MSAASEGRQARIIEELRSFIKKVLSDPSVAKTSMEIARKYKHDLSADKKIAEEISAATTVRIPDVLSDADKIFIEIIREVLEDESALY
ncbi:MAG: hypothetical protein H6999_12230 [Hahellaceae bacterium]|nr:hypothetical protein [Hahellaceae bacterium]MCP5170509.1 hypothetical protein [Hahellaceae bacterium]